MPRSVSRKSPRKSSAQAQLSPATEKRLFNYAALAGAAGVGVLALAAPSEAEIVYTPTHQRIGAHALFQLDLNGDGINDFAFSLRSSPGRANVGTFSTRSGAAIVIYPAVKTNQIWGAAGSASALPAGVTLSSKGKFGSNEVMGSVSALDGGIPRYDGPWAPQGGVKNRYMGFKFAIGGQVHYGWARFTVLFRLPKHGGVAALLTGYAYETVAGKAIITGKIKGAEVAESHAQPASLGRLAQGNAGLVAWRRD